MNMRREKTAGVIGGMGPEATAEFFHRVVAATPARDDADHLHILIDNNPKVPSRINALIEGHGEDPAPALAAMAKGLERAGADFLVMPCNTAHHYLPQIARAVSIPVLDMVALSVAKLAALKRRPEKIGMLASPAVRLVGLYDRRLRENGFEPVFPDAQDEERILRIIKAVKANGMDAGLRADYAAVIAALAERNVDAFLVACTELSVLGFPKNIQLPAVDALDVLVAATVETAFTRDIASV